MKRVITSASYRVAVRGRNVALRIYVFEPEVVEIAEYEYWSVPCTVETDGDSVLAFNTVGVSTLQALSTTMWLLAQRLEQELGLKDFDWEAGSTVLSGEEADGPTHPRNVNRAVPAGEAYVAASNGGWNGEDVQQFAIQIFAPKEIHEGVQIAVASPGLGKDKELESTNGVAALIEAFRYAHGTIVEKFDPSWRFRLGDESPVEFDAFQAIYFGDENSPLRSVKRGVA